MTMADEDKDTEAGGAVSEGAPEPAVDETADVESEPAPKRKPKSGARSKSKPARQRKPVARAGGYVDHGDGHGWVLES